jgi:hypothetical protein
MDAPAYLSSGVDPYSRILVTPPLRRLLIQFKGFGFGLPNYQG